MTGIPGTSVSIVVVSYNTQPDLRRCLWSLRQDPSALLREIIVIDNASPDGSAEMVSREFPEVRLLRSSTNDGYGVAVNRAVLETRGDYLLLLNPDTEVIAGALDALVDFARIRPTAGVVGPRLVLSDGQPQASARRFPSAAMLLTEALRLHKVLPPSWRARLLLGTYFPQDVTREVPWVSGACHLIPRAVWERVGPLTEETFCGFDDLDYCYRVRRAGYVVWLCAGATVRHHCSVAVRGRWSPWEVEQVAIHSAYVVLSGLWPRWKLKAYCATEGAAWVIEWLREMVIGARHTDTAEASGTRLRKRLRLTLRLLFGLEEPRRRFQPRSSHPSEP